MNVIKKIVAFFTFKGKKEQMELEAAEINYEGVILHSTEDPEHSFFVKTTDVEILLNNGKEFTDDDIIVIDNVKSSYPSPRISSEMSPTFDENFTPIEKDFVPIAKEQMPMEEAKEIGRNIQPRALSSFMPSKKRFTVMLYPDEYDMLMKTINDNGYKRVEYFLACMTSAKKQSLASTYKNYTSERQKRYKAALSEAKRAQAEDYYTRRTAINQPQA